MQQAVCSQSAIVLPRRGVMPADPGTLPGNQVGTSVQDKRQNRGKQRNCDEGPKSFDESVFVVHHFAVLGTGLALSE
ncbi:MAG: hypothetical protein WCZ18_07025 [Ottowia sp.]|nr:hypothetical protein [Ottowia sp.]